MFLMSLMKELGLRISEIKDLNKPFCNNYPIVTNRKVYKTPSKGNIMRDRIKNDYDNKDLIKKFGFFKKQRSKEYLQKCTKKPEKITILQNILFRYIDLPNIDYEKTAIIKIKDKYRLLESTLLVENIDTMRNNSLEQGIPIKTLLVNKALLFEKTKNLWVYGLPLDYFSSVTKKEDQEWYLVKDSELLKNFREELIQRISDNQETIDEELTRQDPDLGRDDNLQDYILTIEEESVITSQTNQSE